MIQSPSKTRKIKWSDSLIEESLRKLNSQLGHFPSVAEMRGLGFNDLSCAITKRGGSLFWASKLGLSRITSDSDTGWKGEDNVLSLLGQESFRAEKATSRKASFDILVEDIIRLDVKSASYAEYGNSTGWFYRLDKTPQADLVILHQLDTLNNYVIPWNHCPTTNITISKTGGKYIDYKNNWDILRDYLNGLSFIAKKMMIDD